MYNPYSGSQHFHTKPVVLCFSGLDPSGGAGIQADIESLSSTGCHCAPIITCLTAQNTQNVQAWHPVNPGMIAQQIKCIFEDIPVSAIKIGMVGTIENLEIIQELLIDRPNIPVVFDPVMQSGTGQELSTLELQNKIRDQLVPLTTLLTPNSDELKKLLGGITNVEQGVYQVLGLGCEAVCVTGGHLQTPKLRNRLWQDYELIYDRCWNRIPGDYHGTGCTFASAAAGYLAQGMSLLQAVTKADEFTWQAVSKGFSIGQGQAIPNRHFLLTDPKKADSTIPKKSLLAH